MPEKTLTEQQHESDEVELRRLESNLDNESSDDDIQSDESTLKRRGLMPWIIAAGVLAVIGLITLALVWSRQSTTDKTEVSVTAEKKEDEHSEGEEAREVSLDPEALESAGIEVEGVTSRPAIALLWTTGSIEVNPQRMQIVSPLVGGRIEEAHAEVGDYVQRGSLLAVIASPQIAEMHGKLHESETRYELAQRNMSRVTRAENRVAVLSAKAKLDEAEATLNRTRRLIELGAGAGKDLVAAETVYRTAKADYDFQSNISLNKEIQEARAEVETSRVDVKHIKDQMRALGVNLSAHEADNSHRLDTARVPIYAPSSGMVTERPLNPGAGVEAGTTVFILSDLSTVFAIANVPEAQIRAIRNGTSAEIRPTALGEGTINARVTYIDPSLNEDTRTGKVRLEVPNSDGRLKAGMFVEVGFQTGIDQSKGEELVVKSEAIQRVGEKTVVFVPKDDEPGAFEIREVQVGGEVGEYTRIKGGLEIGDKVVTRGSFTLKTQMQKGELGDDDH
jgi:RND family efflux transporter MFP subunit